jgi:hypothetical protein
VWRAIVPKLGWSPRIFCNKGQARQNTVLGDPGVRRLNPSVRAEEVVVGLLFVVPWVATPAVSWLLLARRRVPGMVAVVVLFVAARTVSAVRHGRSVDRGLTL